MTSSPRSTGCQRSSCTAMSRGRCGRGRSWSSPGQERIELPTADPTELYRYSNLDTFLEIFWLVQSTLGSREDWARLAHESIVDGAAHGLVYREMFFTPARHLDAGQDLADIGRRPRSRAADEVKDARAMLIADIDRAFGGAAARRGSSGRSSCARRRPRGPSGSSGRAGLDRGGGRFDRLRRGVRAGRQGGAAAAFQPGAETPPSHIWAGLDVLDPSASTTGCRACKIRSWPGGWRGSGSR